MMCAHCVAHVKKALEGIDGVEAVVIDERDEVSWTSGLEERLSLIPTLPRW